MRRIERWSVLPITRGAGFAQYGGLPVVIESHFHIPEEEYRRRRMLPWPGAGNGAFVPRDERAKQPPKPPRKPGPTVTGEVIGDDDPLAGLDDLFGRPGSTPPRRPGHANQPVEVSIGERRRQVLGQGRVAADPDAVKVKNSSAK